MSPAAAQTWTGAAVDGGNWNTAANWANPSQVPNSATADVVFAPTAVANFVSIGSAFQVRSLTFASATNNYTLSTPVGSGQMLTDLQTITVADNVMTTQTINLPNFASGSLLFGEAGMATPLTLTNNALLTAVATPTLLIGPNTVIGTPGTGGITVTGTGTTTISGSFANGSNQVLGGLTKSGPGTLTLSGNGATLFGGLRLAGGTLRLDYTTNTASKLGSGALTSSGGDLILVPHASTAVTQNVFSTTLTAGHMAIIAQPGANVTIGLGAITRSAGATLDLSPGGANLFATTSTGTTNGLLGNGVAFATVGGQFWASASGGSLFGINGSNAYGPGSNTDASISNSLGTVTTNSLRFIANGLTLNVSGTLTIQSAGILLPSNVSTATITGGTLEGVIAHVYGSELTIGSNISAPGGITKTGPGTLTLAGNNVNLSGPVNINRGELRVTNPLAINTLTAINFNDARTAADIQRFTVEVGDNTNAATNAAIRLSASPPGEREATIFTTGTSQNSRVTLGGVIASAPGAVTPLEFTAGTNLGTSGFKLTGANTFTGTVNLLEGSLGITSNASLGNPGNTLTLDTFNATAGGLEFLNGGIDVTGPVIIRSITRVVSNGFDINTISGPVTGGGTLVKAGTGTLVLTNAGNAGPRDVRGGTLRVAAGALGTTGNLTLGDGTTLAVTGNNSFAAARVLTLGSAAGPATATIDVSANQTFTVAALVANNGGSPANPFTLLKTGAGTLALTQLANTYTGGTVVRAGTVQAAADGSLGPAAAPVAVEVGGRLTYTGATTTARTFTMPGGTLEAAAGATVTLSGSTVNGGFFRGDGVIELAGNASVSGTTTFNGTTVNQVGPAALINFTNGGKLTNMAGQTLTWNGGINTSSGNFIANGSANVSDWSSNGVVMVNGGGAIDNSASNLVLGGGSRTTINPSATLATAVGTTIELNGGLLVNNGIVSGTTNVNFGSLAKGTGVYGVVNVNQGGIYAPGNSPGIVTAAEVHFDNTPVSSGAPTLEIELAGIAPGTQYDQLHVTGQLALGGTLAVSFINSFAPTSGNSFDVLDWGSLTGTFSAIQLPTLAGNLAWNTSQLYTMGVLSVVSAGLPGDYNLNGIVDGADYVVWRKGLGTIYTQTDYNVWRANFGRPPGSGTGVTANAAIPEPTTVKLLFLAVTSLRLWRRRNS